MTEETKHLRPYWLGQQLKDFQVHCEAIGNDPILLVGPTGVGKTIFLEEFKKMIPGKAVYQDCSHYRGEDANISRSELFGHKRGSFTGANNDNEGLVKEADGSALILDEVGELPDSVQAMLLTFVETGQYRSVGGRELKRVNIRIIAATNNELALREELRFRFFPFHITPLHGRREDILPYFAYLAEDAFKRLSSWEVLTLMAYCWPGNVRELVRVGRLISYYEKLYISNSEIPRARGLAAISDKSVPGLDPFVLHSFCSRLKQSGVDIDLADKVLGQYGLSLKIEHFNAQKPFNLDAPVWIEDGAGKGASPEYDKIFSRVIEGFRLFCDIFCLCPNKGENLLNPGEEWELNRALHGRAMGGCKPNIRNHVKKLTKQVGVLLTSRKVKAENVPLSRYKFEDLEREYLTQVLARSNGSKAEGARIADLKPGTFDSKLRKHKLYQRKKNIH